MNRKELFWISVTVFLTIVSWMMLDIYKVKISADSGSGMMNIVKINFKIDPEILDVLKKKVQ